MLQTLRFILTHPLTRHSRVHAITTYIRWQLATRLVPEAIAMPFVGQTRLLISRGMTGATGNVYSGLHDYSEMAFLLHWLSSEDLFIDIGANIGSYTILAAGAASANVVAVEPISSTRANLLNNIKLNHLETLVEICPKGLSNCSGERFFSSDSDTMNGIVEHPTVPSTNTVELEVTTLDTLLSGRQATALKIDVEGHEAEVLEGAASQLSHAGLQVIICEMNEPVEMANRTSAVRTSKLSQMLHDQGFVKVIYDPAKRTIEPSKEITPHNRNAIFIRDLETAKTRVQSSPKFNTRFGAI